MAKKQNRKILSNKKQWDGAAEFGVEPRGGFIFLDGHLDNMKHVTASPSATSSAEGVVAGVTVKMRDLINVSICGLPLEYFVVLLAMNHTLKTQNSPPSSVNWHLGVTKVLKSHFGGKELNFLRESSTNNPRNSG